MRRHSPPCIPCLAIGIPESLHKWTVQIHSALGCERKLYPPVSQHVGVFGWFSIIQNSANKYILSLFPPHSRWAFKSIAYLFSATNSHRKLHSLIQDNSSYYGPTPIVNTLSFRAAGMWWTSTFDGDRRKNRSQAMANVRRRLGTERAEQLHNCTIQ